ncbi:hypothetical protein TSOC_001275, partial [Tetrabaena socialis]
CDGAALLLKRSAASGNPGSWGLPGGNADEVDGGKLLETAEREAREEVGALPSGLHVAGSVLTRRGKALQKHYTVFIAHAPSAARAAYLPTLNEEHTEWRWVDMAHVAALAHAPKPKALVGDAPAADMVLHPVVRALFGAEHAGVLPALLAATPPPADSAAL